MQSKVFLLPQTCFNSSNVFFKFALFQQIFQFTDLSRRSCTFKLREKLYTQIS